MMKSAQFCYAMMKVMICHFREPQRIIIGTCPFLCSAQPSRFIDRSVGDMYFTSRVQLI